MRKLFARLIAIAASFIFFGMDVRELIQRGGRMPGRTIVSRTGYSPQRSEDALVLLDYASRVLPVDSTVSFIDPDKRGSDWMYYAIAVGQMPRQRVVLPESHAQRPEYVVVFHGRTADERYRLVVERREGTLWHLR